MVEKGFCKEIYATETTCKLMPLALYDNLKVLRDVAKRKNVKCLYREESVERVIDFLKPCKINQTFKIGNYIKVTFLSNGHLLGAASILVQISYPKSGTINILFSGDYNNKNMFFNVKKIPAWVRRLPLTVIQESTYGDMDTSEIKKCFKENILKCIKENGTVVAPVFSLGRAQEILYELNIIKEERSKDEAFQKEYETLMRAPVYVDSPLAISATEVFKNNEDLFDDETKAIMERGDNPLEFPGLKFTRTADESKALNESDEPSIIISASGMCEVGRIKHHLKHNIWNPNSTILFVGYQAPGTLGRSIVDGAKKVKIFGEEFSVKARIEYIEGYSGHADQEWLLNFVYSFIKKPKHIFLVHGEPNGQLVLKNKIVDTTQIPVTIPGYGEKYTLDDNFTVEKKYEDPIDKRYLRLEVLDRIETLQEEIEDMKNIIKEDLLSKERSDDDVKRVNEKVKELEQRIVDIIENS